MRQLFYYFLLTVSLYNNCMVEVFEDGTCKTWTAGSPICSIAFTSDNSMIVTGHNHSRLCFHERNDEGGMKKTEWDCREFYGHAQVDKDAVIGGKRFIFKYIEEENTLQVYEEDTSHSIVHWKFASAACPAAESETLVCTSEHSSVAKVIKKKNSLTLYDHDDNVLQQVEHGRVAAFSTDENWLAIGCLNGKVMLLRLSPLCKSSRKR